MIIEEFLLYVNAFDLFLTLDISLNIFVKCLFFYLHIVAQFKLLLSRNIPGGTDEIHKTIQQEVLVCRLRYEPRNR
jgi:hypothetical protein